MDSNEVSLGMVDVDSADVDVFYALQDADPSQAFLKGLCIVDDIAFFGIAPSSPRSSRADQDLECELAAYDLLNHKLLFRKRLPTNGLLNVVSAPQLAVRVFRFFVAMGLGGTRWDSVGLGGTRWDSVRLGETRWDSVGLGGTRWDALKTRVIG